LHLFQPVAAANIVVDMIIQNTSIEGHTDLTFTVPKGDLKKTLAIVKPVAPISGWKRIERGEHRQGLHRRRGHEEQRRGGARMFEAMAAENINILMISTSEIKISCVIEDKYGELAVRVLHDAFGLDVPPLKKK